MGQMGRKRRAGVPRHPGGKIIQKIAQQERERETKATVIDARCRLFKMTKKDADTQEAGHALGRAYRLGVITLHQFRAGEEYERIQRDHQKAIGVKKQGSGSDLNRTGGFDASEGDDPDYVDWCAAARRRYAETRRALLETPTPLASHACETWILAGIEAWSLIGDLREALNVLARLYRVDQWQKGVAA